MVGQWLAVGVGALAIRVELARLLGPKRGGPVVLDLLNNRGSTWQWGRRSRDIRKGLTAKDEDG